LVNYYFCIVTIERCNIHCNNFCRQHKKLIFLPCSKMSYCLMSRKILGSLIEKCIGTHGFNNVAKHPQTLQFGQISLKIR
jgi:hypothetical protein